MAAYRRKTFEYDDINVIEQLFEHTSMIVQIVFLEKRILYSVLMLKCSQYNEKIKKVKEHKHGREISDWRIECTRNGDVR